MIKKADKIHWAPTPSYLMRYLSIALLAGLLIALNSSSFAKGSVGKINVTFGFNVVGGAIPFLMTGQLYNVDKQFYYGGALLPKGKVVKSSRCYSFRHEKAGKHKICFNAKFHGRNSLLVELNDFGSFTNKVSFEILMPLGVTESGRSYIYEKECRIRLRGVSVKSFIEEKNSGFRIERKYMCFISYDNR